MTNDTTKKIAELNDLCRTARGVAGPLPQTSGTAFCRSIRHPRESREIRCSTPDNDPYDEHEFGAFEHNGEQIFWKID